MMFGVKPAAAPLVVAMEVAAARLLANTTSRKHCFSVCTSSIHDGLSCNHLFYFMD